MATLPGNHEIAISVDGSTGVALIARRCTVNFELAALRNTTGVIALGIDAIATAIACCTSPSDNEIASTRCHSQCWKILVVEGGRCDKKLAALRNTAGVKALRINTEATTVLDGTHPYNDEIACVVHGHISIVL